MKENGLSSAEASSTTSPQRPAEPSWRKGLRWAAFGVLGLWVAHNLFGPKGGPKAEQSMPALTAVRADAAGASQPFDLTAWRGQPVVVEFMASWCGVCERAAPMLAHASRAEREREVRWVAVSVDEQLATAAQAAKAWNIPYPVVLADPGVAARWQVTHLPTLVVIDDAGVVRHVNVGALREATLESQLASVGARRR